MAALTPADPDCRDNSMTNPYTNIQLAEIDIATGYITNIDDIRDKYYPTLQGTTYLDHAGATTYPNSLIDAYASELKSSLFGNPHSASASSQLSTRRIDAIRAQVLQYMNADPNEFELVFVANATAAIKLVADAFRDHDNGFWYGYHCDSHTSLVGVRELATRGSRCMTDADVVTFLTGKCRDEMKAKSLVLLAYPGQSNMTGQRYSPDWCRQLRQKACKEGWQMYSLYDAAGLLSTSELDLGRPQDAPDFTVLSFYKIFGFPDLGGLIIRKASAGILRSRKYFGGGTVDAVSVDGKRWHAKRERIHSSLEDGTLPFHTIIALDHAIATHAQIFGRMQNVSRHTRYLTSIAYNKMKSLRHGNGRRLCHIYSNDPACNEQSTGPVITFNMIDSCARWISTSEVEKLGVVRGIQFRTGGLCNPGGTAQCLNLSTDQIKQNYDAGLRCGSTTDILSGQPTGTIRISFGASSSLRDVDSFIAFLRDFFLESSVADPEEISLPPTISPLPQFVVDTISIFPIKSCGGFSVPAESSWKVYPKGLQFDREWCLVHQATNIALSQKQFPQMTQLQPYIDLKHRVMSVAFAQDHFINSSNDAVSHHKSISIDLDEFPVSEGVMSKACNQFRNQHSTICGESVLVHLYTSRTVSDFFSQALGVPCTLARFPEENTVQPRRMSIRRPALSPDPSPERYSGPSIKLSNESPVLLISRSSVNKLNAQIKARNRHNTTTTTISADAFRANIVIAETRLKPDQTESAYVEDEMQSIKIQGSQFTVLGPCQRCQMVCVDQSSGTRRPEPFSTLAKTRRKDGRVWFGMHLCLSDHLHQPAVIKVGDLVDVTMRSGGLSPSTSSR